VGDFTVATEKRVVEIVSGAIEGANEMGEDVFITIKSTVSGIVKAGSEVGADVAKTAVAATEGAIKVAAGPAPISARQPRKRSRGHLKRAIKSGHRHPRP